MKNFILQLIFSCLLLNAFAQGSTGIDSSLKFDQRIAKCEKKWVVIGKKDTSKEYFYGFVYVDQQAGFTFDLKGKFTIDQNNRYVPDTSISKNKSVKYRIAANWSNVALLPPQHFKELNITGEPSWLKIYYAGKDTSSAYYNYRMGFAYNVVGEFATALIYLKKACYTKPYPQGVDFEMAFAYNAMQQCDDAIKVSLSAIQNKPGDPLLYKELGYAYSCKKDYENAINTYKKGLEYFPDSRSDSKGEMALNTAVAYRTMGNQDEYKNWMMKAKEYTPLNSVSYKRIVAAGF